MKNDLALPEGFVYVSSLIDDVDEAIFYASTDNFIGQQVDGYLSAKAILTLQAAEALAQIQQVALSQGLYLKIFDAYRPTQAVEHFLRWVNEEESLSHKQRFHPDFSKAELFKEGYLASHSSHSRGSTVDLTLASQKTGKELDMGTEFDFFGKESWSSNQNLSSKQLSNRQCLRRMMVDHNFSPFELEWWHFTLLNEPFPDQAFNFIVK